MTTRRSSSNRRITILRRLHPGEYIDKPGLESHRLDAWRHPIMTIGAGPISQKSGHPMKKRGGGIPDRSRSIRCKLSPGLDPDRLIPGEYYVDMLYWYRYGSTIHCSSRQMMDGPYPSVIDAFKRRSPAHYRFRTAAGYPGCAATDIYSS